MVLQDAAALGSQLDHPFVTCRGPSPYRKIKCYKLSRYREYFLKSGFFTELPDSIIWIDVFSPTEQEKEFVQSRTGVRIPSVEALSEIRILQPTDPRRGTIYFDTPVVARADTANAFFPPWDLS